MSNIWDVAKLAGVSKSTVSRVMNSGPSSPETKAAVMEAVRKLNYMPSSFARSIRTQKSMTIAFMVPDASNLFYTELFKAIESVAFEKEYMVILCDTQNNPEYEIKYAEKLIHRKIDGLIYGTYKMNAKTQNYFVTLSKELPIVFIDYAFKKYEDIILVATEGYNSSRDAVKFLYQKGRHNIGYINFPEDVEVTKLRYQGYIKGLEDCGLPFSSSLICYPQPEKKYARDLGYEGAKQLLENNPRIDAIMTAADPLAVGAMKYLKKKGVRIPEDINIIGFDNNEICDIIEPTLTTISQPLHDIGTESAKILFNKIYNLKNEKERIIFKGELTQRKST